MVATRKLDHRASPPDISRAAPASYNLNGQKLGRKGRDTRERILVAAADLIANEPETPISLSAVARKASLGMTSLYNYFEDLTELVIAVLEPVMATTESEFLCILREYWPDDELADRCAAFVHAFYGFWDKHSLLLHLRNNMSDMRDVRMMNVRLESTQPVIRLLIEQMDGDVDKESPATAMATVLITGVERSITLATDHYLQTFWGGKAAKERYLWPAARIMELTVRDARANMAEFAKMAG